MKKIYNILCGFLILSLLLVGIVSVFDRNITFSEVENRDLKTFPGITVSGLIDGSFMCSLREYYADTFPGREGTVETKNRLNIFFCFDNPDDASGQ